MQCKPDTRFPSLADEIAEPRPDMSINDAAFIVTKTFNNNAYYNLAGYQ